MAPAEIIEELKAATEGAAVLYPDLEEALIGVCRRFGRPPVALYDYNKCVEIVMREMEGEENAYEQAVEHLEYNTLGAWVGEHTPAFAVLPQE